MDTSSEPLVVVQTDDYGCGVIVGLAFETESSFRKVGKLLNDTTTADSTGAERYLSSVVQEGPSPASSATVSRGLIRQLSRRFRSSSKLAIQRCLISSLLPIDRLVQFLFDDERSEIQEQAAKALASLSTSSNGNRLKIANSFQAMAGLSRLLFMDNPSSQYHAAVALGNVAALEDNAQSFRQFPEALTGLVWLLFGDDDVLTQKGAATALANLSFWQEGGEMILDTPHSITGLVRMALMMHDDDQGQEEVLEAKRALVNLALSRENGRILESPNALVALAGLLSLEDMDELNSTCPLLQEKAIRALASLSCTKENAQKISESGDFCYVLAVVVRLLVLGPMTSTAMQRAGRSSGQDSSSSGLAVRKMAAIVLANICITEDIQLTVADFPGALEGLFMSLELKDGVSAPSLQLQECAAMALGNLALAKDNRRKIVEFGSYGLGALASVLFQDENPGGQEYAAWALGNLSHDAYDFPRDTTRNLAVKIADAPNVVRGLARLVLLPTTDHHNDNILQVKEEAAGALANLFFPHENQVKIAQLPNVVTALAALLSSPSHQKSNPMMQEHAARAFANLTYANENWKSSRIFCCAIGGLIDVVSCGNSKESQKVKQYAAIALGNFALAPSHHRRIISSQHAMTGLVRMLYSCDNPGGKEQAAWVLANLAHGDYSTKTALVSFPSAVTGLVGLLSKHESPHVRDQAKRALAGLGDVLKDDSVFGIPGASLLGDGSSRYHRQFSRFEMPSRAEACIRIRTVH